MKTTQIIGISILVLLVGALFLEANAGDEGFIYGKVITRGGDTYIGALRWGTQEVFWDDIFNATKEENPWLRYVEKDNKRNKDEVEVKMFGLNIITGGGFAGNHMFISRFGDLKEIKVRKHSDALVKTKTGSEYYLTGGGDINLSIQILDDALGKIKLNWDNIKTIEFMETPKKVKREGYRSKGKVKTHEMDFVGYVMWDAEECLSSDILDGDSDNGDMEIEFANIRSLKRESRRSSLVTLKDGRKFSLRGSNDVDDDNRGIYVHDPRYGKIEVNWNDFIEVVYDDDENDSGPGYDSYKPFGELVGTVETFDGKKFSGKIVYDLDETEGFEILNGKMGDMEFYIPFESIKSIEPRGRHTSIVQLRNGEKLRLEDSQDVSDANDGILVFPEKGKHTYIPWEDVEKIIFK